MMNVRRQKLRHDALLAMVGDGRDTAGRAGLAVSRDHSNGYADSSLSASSPPTLRAPQSRQYHLYWSPRPVAGRVLPHSDLAATRALANGSFLCVCHLGTRGWLLGTSWLLAGTGER